MFAIDMQAGQVPVRFGWSPLAEISTSLVVTSRTGQPAWISRWWSEVAAAIPITCLRLLRELVRPRGFIPAFLLPVPVAGGAALDADLHRLVSTSADVVLAEVAQCRAACRVSGVAARSMPLTMSLIEKRGADGFLAVLAEQLEAYWAAAIEPYWRSLRRGLDREISDRGRALAEEGTTAALGRLSRMTTYRHGNLVVTKPSLSSYLVDAPDALRCTASIFLHDDVISGLMTDGTFQIHYPARGVGAAWPRRQTVAASSALRALLGGVRASLLADLGEPCTTADLAHRHKLSASTVSYHVGVLHRAGLLIRERHGKEVRYQRSRIGTALVD